jgi:hypothetical protein
MENKPFWRNVKSNNKDWNTPRKYVNLLYQFFEEIDLDPCSNSSSIVHAKTEYIFPSKDGLRESWNFHRIYVNPPYGISENGTSIEDWFNKIVKSYLEYNSEIIALVPVATNTSYWKKYVYPYASLISFLFDTRLKFRINCDEKNKGSPMACSLIYWGNQIEKFYQVFGDNSAILKIFKGKSNIIQTDFNYLVKK